MISFNRRVWISLDQTIYYQLETSPNFPTHSAVITAVIISFWQQWLVELVLVQCFISGVSTLNIRTNCTYMMGVHSWRHGRLRFEIVISIFSYALLKIIESYDTRELKRICEPAYSN